MKLKTCTNLEKVFFVSNVHFLGRNFLKADEFVISDAGCRDRGVRRVWMKNRDEKNIRESSFGEWQRNSEYQKKK